MSAENSTSSAPTAPVDPPIETGSAEAAPTSAADGEQTKELANFLTSTGPEDYHQADGKARCKRCAAKGKPCQGRWHKVKKTMHGYKEQVCQMCHCGKDAEAADATPEAGAAHVEDPAPACAAAAEDEACQAAPAAEPSQEAAMPDAATNPNLDAAPVEPAPDKPMMSQEEPVPIVADVQGPMPADPK